MLSGPGKLMLLKGQLPHLDAVTLDNRLVLQKTVYLLQQMGLDLGYRFSWYVRGPYSPPLAADAFEALQTPEARQEYGEEVTAYRFTPSSKSVIDTYKEIIGERESDAEWLEILGSLLFVWRGRGSSATDDAVVTTLLNEKPKYKERSEELREAMEFLRKHFSAPQD